MKIKTILFIMLSVGLFTSCAKRKAKKQEEDDDRLIQEYLQENNLSATKTETGLYYIVDIQGTGLAAHPTSDVRVAYSGYLLDGSQFDASDAQGITFNLQNVIAGWTEGIPKFNEGGSGKLVIPSALAYGPNARPGIPANSVLIFDVELLEVFP